jgi:hypothetical protein
MMNEMPTCALPQTKNVERETNITQSVLGQSIMFSWVHKYASAFVLLGVQSIYNHHIFKPTSYSVNHKLNLLEVVVEKLSP